ncbi:hypothetical protein STAS_16324 [Striga asiatica]|uniref:Uncharacterized protein n=1 Tax=Striga asiatica TaxID=4170 RepID=A0A5A7Q467_STRAF|nr:hypothetical protein STAS_16324 [Striga asiatica]
MRVLELHIQIEISVLIGAARMIRDAGDRGLIGPAHRVNSDSILIALIPEFLSYEDLGLQEAVANMIKTRLDGGDKAGIRGYIYRLNVSIDRQQQWGLLGDALDANGAIEKVGEGSLSIDIIPNISTIAYSPRPYLLFRVSPGTETSRDFEGLYKNEITLDARYLTISTNPTSIHKK